jgi:uncharacterized protein (TIGR02453 family)
MEEILQFLKDLAANNERPWFQANKSRYESTRATFLAYVQELIGRMAAFDPEISGVEAADCAFRIYRDIRFSPNKMPYKTHYGAFIAAGGGHRSPRGGYYLHIQPGSCMLSGGVWGPDPRLLKMLRRDIYERCDEFLAILEKPSFKAAYPDGLGEEDMLKRLPAGFPPDFAHDDWLRHKYYCVSTFKPDSFFLKKGWMDKVVDIFKEQVPFNRFLNETVDEYLGRE